MILRPFSFLFALALIRTPALSGQIAAFDQPAFQGKFYDSDMAGPGLPNEVVRYADADHGFHCDERPSFHPESSSDAWARTLAFLGDHLG